LEIRFHKRQVSFLVVKTVKCKRGINYDAPCQVYFNFACILSNLHKNESDFKDGINVTFISCY